jgi:hypothetical protein
MQDRGRTCRRVKCSKQHYVHSRAVNTCTPDTGPSPVPTAGRQQHSSALHPPPPHMLALTVLRSWPMLWCCASSSSLGRCKLLASRYLWPGGSTCGGELLAEGAVMCAVRWRRAQ